MNQLLKNFISLGNTGNICYLQATLKDFDTKESSTLEKRIQDLKTKKITRLVFAYSLTEKNNYDSLSEPLKKNGIQIYFYTSNSEIKAQVELFESILDSNKQGNISIVYDKISSGVIELVIKLVLYINPSLPIEEVYSYFSNEELDIVTLNEFKEYTFFLENDPYLITKPDRKEFKKTNPKSQITNGAKSTLTIEEPKTNTAFTLNLNSLKNSNLDDEKLLTETQEMRFNLNSLIESDFEKEESPEEHYEKIKNTAHREVDDSLSLDVDLSEEIEYISSLESLSTGSTKDKISIVGIDTVPLDKTFESTKITNPTIDYKNKQYIDFDAIIEDEIEQGMLSEEFGINLSAETDSFQKSINFDEIIADDKEEMFSFEDHIVHEDADSAINLDIMETKANIDLSFPSPLSDLEDLLEEDMELESEVTGETENLVDPSQTFMVKRINEVIKKEVLNDDSKSKIPVSDLTKVDTNTTEAVSKKTNPTLPKVSNPKISSPKFNPITLDD